MENEIVKREGQSFIERLIENTDSLEKVKEVGMVIINSGFCPQHFKDSKDAVGAIMCIEAGRKLGLSWMQSLSDIYPVKGRIGIMGTAAKAVIFSSGVLESWKEYTEGEYPNKNYKHITESKRKGLPDVFRTEFSVYDAEMAGLMGKDIYKKYGKRMIAWRDIGFHASDYYQDILKGMKTVEELNDYDGLVPGTPEKIVLKTEDGKELTFTDKDKEHSTKTTSRVANKIPDNKFGSVKNENIQEATVVTREQEMMAVRENLPKQIVGEPSADFIVRYNAYVEKAMKEYPEMALISMKPHTEDSPFVATKDSTEYMNGVKVIRDPVTHEITNMSDIEMAGREGDTAPAESIPEVAGSYTLAGLEKLDTEVLKKIVMEDMDMMESSEIIGGKNTKKKLAEIIMAHQEGRLDSHVAPYLKANGEKQKQFEASQAEKAVSTGEIAPNKDFDRAKEDAKIDAFLSKEPLPKKEPDKLAGNKYALQIDGFGPNGNRDFGATKQLFNALAGLTPSINAQRYLELAVKLGYAEKYKDKEVFLRAASVEEINALLNSN
jgi:hypothetical protein